MRFHIKGVAEACSALFFTAAILSPASVFAEEVDPMAACDAKYESCTDKCNNQENVEAECYTACDDNYQRCLDIANGYAPEPAPAEKKPKKAAASSEAVTEQ